MRLPRVRFTVRRMMIVVALVAVVAAFWIRAERWEFRRQCLSEAAYYARAEAKMRRLADMAAKLGTEEVLLRAVLEEGDFYRRANRWWTLRAERPPWVAVPPEPSGSENPYPVDP